jgi:hypothetical protein
MMLPRTESGHPFVSMMTVLQRCSILCKLTHVMCVDSVQLLRHHVLQLKSKDFFKIDRVTFVQSYA